MFTRALHCLQEPSYLPNWLYQKPHIVLQNGGANPAVVGTRQAYDTVSVVPFSGCHVATHASCVL